MVDFLAALNRGPDEIYQPDELYLDKSGQPVTKREIVKHAVSRARVIGCLVERDDQK
jgi:hypothetical protein